jgi:hypothetical protein
MPNKFIIKRIHFDQTFKDGVCIYSHYEVGQRVGNVKVLSIEKRFNYFRVFFDDNTYLEIYTVTLAQFVHE